MPQIASWNEFPPGVRRHLIQRMAERQISVTDLNRLRLWIETEPSVPEGDLYKDFSTFKICGTGKYPKTFLLPGQAAKGHAL
jgi:hypothetical protein